MTGRGRGDSPEQHGHRAGRAASQQAPRQHRQGDTWVDPALGQLSPGTQGSPERGGRLLPSPGRVLAHPCVCGQRGPSPGDGL